MGSSRIWVATATSESAAATATRAQVGRTSSRSMSAAMPDSRGKTAWDEPAAAGEFVAAGELGAGELGAVRAVPASTVEREGSPVTSGWRSRQVRVRALCDHLFSRAVPTDPASPPHSCESHAQIGSVEAPGPSRAVPQQPACPRPCRSATEDQRSTRRCRSRRARSARSWGVGPMVGRRHAAQLGPGVSPASTFLSSSRATTASSSQNRTTVRMAVS